MKNIMAAKRINHTDTILQSSLNWLDIRQLNSQHEYSQQYQEICKQHAINNKWILMINPEQSALESLATDNELNTTRVLRIDANKVKVSIENIQSALCKGNCSAIVLNDISLQDDDMSQLKSCAQKGKTQCIVIKRDNLLH